MVTIDVSEAEEEVLRDNGEAAVLSGEQCWAVKKNQEQRMHVSQNNSIRNEYIN